MERGQKRRERHDERTPGGGLFSMRKHQKRWISKDTGEICGTIIVRRLGLA